MADEPSPPGERSGGSGGVTSIVGIGPTESARLCRQAWTERLIASDDGVYRAARDGLATMAQDDTLPPRERRLAREALLHDQRAGESVEIDLLKIASVENRPSGTVNIHVGRLNLPSAAVDAASACLASIAAGFASGAPMGPK